MAATEERGEKEFEPANDAQKQFLESTAEQVLLSGSFGAGKSRVGCEKGYYLNQLYPGNRGLIVRKHFSDVKASTVEQTLIEEVIPNSHIVKHNKSDHKIVHYTDEKDPNGEPVTSEIHYHGLDSGKSTGDDDLPRKIGSTAWGWIFVDEGTELKRGEWNQLQGRLRYKGKTQGGKQYRIPFHQIFAATNPASKQHWMYEEFFGDPDPDTQAYKMSVQDNPHNPDSYIARLKANLSGMYYERYFLGNWVGAEGMIYNEWDPQEHHLPPNDLPGECNDEDCEVDECNGWHVQQSREYEDGTAYWVEPPNGWRVYRSIDIGYNNPFVCQWWARSQDDEFVMFRELYKTGLLLDDAADEITTLTNDDWPHENTFSDHDAEGTKRLHRNDVYTTNASKEVSPGIQAVKRRMMLDDRGRPGLYVMQGSRVHEPDSDLNLDDKPLSTVDEIPEYVWKDDDKDKPKKKDDHGMDAMRYLIASVDEGSSMSMEEIQEWNEIVNDAW